MMRNAVSPLVGASLLLPVLAACRAGSAQDYVIDNPDPGFRVVSGSWTTGTSAAHRYGADYRYHTSSGGGSTTFGEVEWRSELLEPGSYEVAVWFPDGGNRADNAPFTVHHSGGLTTVPINQRLEGNGGVWNVLGSFPFNAGTAGFVSLDNQATASLVVGDAARFRFVASAPAQPVFRGFWADAFHEGFRGTAQIDAMVDRAVAGNYNAIVAEVLAYHDNVGGGHGAYWGSSVVPRATDIVGGIDPLEYLCDRAHQYGIEVHAWLVTYRVSTSWPPSGNAMVAAHPEWIMVPAAGLGNGPATIDGKYTLDPGSPEVQEYLIGIVRELVMNYEIDGINWDYVRYTQRDAGYPSSAAYPQSSLARFQRLTGRTDVPSSTDAQWSDFRRRTINELVSRCRVEMSAIADNPRQPLRLTADLICFGSPPTNFTGTDAYLLHQNWKHWLEMGWLDAGMPMNYKRETTASQAQQYRDWISRALAYRSGRHVFCGQANYLNTKADSITQLQHGLGRGAQGTVNYSYYAVSDEDLDGNFENDWTWYSYVADNLFAGAVPTPPMEWRDPAVATEGAIWGRVTDRFTGAAIENASVTVGAMAPALTDGNGYFVVTRVPASAAGTPYAVQVTAGAYDPVIVPDVVVFAGEPDGPTRLDVVVPQPPMYGDFNDDGHVNNADYPFFVFCMQGPAVTYAGGTFCTEKDGDGDGDVDAGDYGAFQRVCE